MAVTPLSMGCLVLSSYLPWTLSNAAVWQSSEVLYPFPPLLGLTIKVIIPRKTVGAAPKSFLIILLASFCVSLQPIKHFLSISCREDKKLLPLLEAFSTKNTPATSFNRVYKITEAVVYLLEILTRFIVMSCIEQQLKCR